MKKILEGIRILDLGRIISAPYCAMLLADFGAEVIKVEKAGTGDDMRAMAVFDYPAVNRNKKSVTLQFRSEEGKQLLRGLIEKSDVLLENFRPGTMEKMGFGYEEVKKIKPGIIMVSVSGFGQTGPYRVRAAFDSIIQAMSGLMSVTGTREAGPVKIGTPLLDNMSGVFAFSAVMLALYNRERTGEGQYIDISMLDCTIPMLFTHIPNYSAFGTVAATNDENTPVAVPSGTYKALDGYIYINGGTVGLFKTIRTLLNSEELLKEKYLEQAYRQKHHVLVNEILAAWVAERCCKEAETIMTEAGIPNGMISNVKEVMENPQIKARNSIVDINVEGYGQVKFAGNPIKMNTYPVDEFRPAHKLGEDNEEVYSKLLGLTRQELKELESRNAI